MKIAIIGSREGFSKEYVWNILENLINKEKDELITGGARGIDNYAELFFKKLKLKSEIIRPINPTNKLDYLFRNIEIITKAEKIIIFWNGYSKGTNFVINYSKARNKKLKIIKKEIGELK